MSKYAVNFNSFAPTAVADTLNFTNSGYAALQMNAAGAVTNRAIVSEILLNGQATSSTVNQIAVARDSTIGATGLSGGTLTSLDPAALALTNTPVQFSTSTTKPQRSATAYLLSLGFNAFGGIVRWVAAPGYEIGLVGLTQPNAEISISTVSGAGQMGAHILFEPI